MAYETNKYAEYFDVDEGYYPEINESSIKDPKNKWQYTFPHKDIVDLLKKTERALSRLDKKSIWLEGSYGTGKSRILWMIRSLLTCSENEFDEYFDEYDNLRGEIDLRERLRTARKGKIVAMSRYATGDITSTQKLIFAVFESLTSALKKNGCKFDGAKTLRGKIASWLEADEANKELFSAKIKKPEYRLSSTLGNRTAQEIIERLKNPQSEVSQLVEEILELGEREGILAFNINMGELVDWITEVIEENKLGAVILFWDEFSKFFNNNRNNLDEFQRLAELSNITPFYLFIATHESKSLVGAGDQAFKIIEDRFIHQEIKMPDNIAFELIGHALKVKDVAQEEWQQLLIALKERTAEPRQKVMEFAKIGKEKILTDILPIHPMAAIALKYLSSLFASNQRSIFNYIKNTDENVKAFQDFISTKSPNDGDVLTVSYLWHFFYDSGTDEHGGNVGRMNLPPSIRAILDTYVLNKENLSYEEQEVLKTVLLFQAIDQDLGGTVDIFRPTEKNLELAFIGDSNLENGRGVKIANDLVRRSILFRKPGKVETFAAMALSGDYAEMDRLKKEIADGARTADLVASANLLEVINLTDSQKHRYALQAVTADNFTAIINRITNEPETYKIKVVVCFARTTDEQHKIQNLIGGAIGNERYRRLVFIDASANLIVGDIFSRWVDNSANERYWRGKDNALADKMKNNAHDCLVEWRDSFGNGFFLYYPATKDDNEERKGISCQGAAKVTEELKLNVRKIFPYSFDDAQVKGTNFMSSSLKRFVDAGANQEAYSSMGAGEAKKILGDVWQMSGKYWEVYPNLNISQLKIELDTMIKSELEKSTRISFDEITAHLLERGFMPLNIYAFLTGFLMKDYAVDPYRFSGGIDGSLGGAMSVQKLSECINDSFKQVSNPSKNYRQKYLEIMSVNQRQFMTFAAEIFGVTEDVSVEQSAQKLRLKLKNLGYPFWCYVDAAADEYKDFLRLLMEIANSSQAVSISALSERAGQFLINNPVTFHDLKNFLTPSNGQKIFTDFLKKFEDGTIFVLAEKIGIENPVAECQQRLISGDAIWLHDKDTATDDLKKLIVDYKIILASERFGIAGKSFGECVRNWADYCRFNLKVQADLISDKFPKLKNFLDVLKEIFKRGEIPQAQRGNFLNQLIDDFESIQRVFDSPLKILKGKFDYQLNGLSGEELKKLYSLLPNNSFIETYSNYHKIILELAKRIKNSQRKNELLSLWHEVAGKFSPRDWSNKYRTPILVMVPQAEQKDAQKVFDTIMTSSPDEKSVKEAIEYLQKRLPYFDAIKNAQGIEEAFRDAIVEDNQVLLSNDDVRNELEIKFRGEVYQWYPKNSFLKNLLDECARNKYYSGGAYDKVNELVQRMSGDEAKELLIKLLDKNYEVGIKLLKESLT